MVGVKREGTDAGKAIGGAGAGEALVDASRAECIVAELSVRTGQDATGVTEEVRIGTGCAGACGGYAGEAIGCT